MAHLLEECRATGRSRHFDTLSPFLSRKPAPEEYEAVAATMGLKMGAIAVAVHRLRVQFRGFVRAEVAAGLNDPAHIDEEMRHLGAAL